MKKITVSGIAIVNEKQQRFNVLIKTSDIPTNYLNGYLLNRYLPEALETLFNEPFTRIRNFEVEKIENIKEESSFYDKSIFELTKKELRDFCCEFLFTGINISKNLNDLQNSVAIEYLNKIKNLNVYDISEFVITTKQGEKIIDFEEMREERNKFLFTIKKSQKPNPKITKKEDGKISIRELEKLETKEIKTIKDKKSKNDIDNENETYLELMK